MGAGDDFTQKIEKIKNDAQLKWNEITKTTQSKWNEIKKINVNQIDYYKLFTFGVSAFALAYISYRVGWKRFTNVDSIPPHYWQKKKLIEGVVTSVGDGDGFHVYHTVCLFVYFVLFKSSSENWFTKQPFLRRYLPLPKNVSNQTISVRIAGVDAPECAHFGQPGQPFGPEAKFSFFDDDDIMMIL